jgi:hypothetical protein
MKNWLFAFEPMAKVKWSTKNDSVEAKMMHLESSHGLCIEALLSYVREG